MRVQAVGGTHDWVVLAIWMGAERVVFRGDLFACLAFAREGVA
jgi:hypothetical protein